MIVPLAIPKLFVLHVDVDADRLRHGEIERCSEHRTKVSQRDEILVDWGVGVPLNPKCVIEDPCRPDVI